jgi:hypothetical protein
MEEIELSPADQQIYSDFLAGYRADLTGMSPEAARSLMGSPAAPAPTLLEKTGAFIAETPGNVADWMTGANVEYPELGGGQLPKSATASDMARYQALIASTLDDYKLEEGIKNIFPDANTEYDKFGNLLVTLEDKDAEGNVIGSSTFYPNPRGLDLPTVFQGVTAAGAVPIAEMAVAGTLGKGAVQGYRGAALTAATEAAVAERVSSSLTGLPYDWSAPAGGAVFGPTFLGLGKAFGKSWPYIKSKFKNNPSEILNSDGTLTESARDYIQGQGIDPDEVQGSLFLSFKSLVDDGYIPDEALIRAQSQGLPVPIDLTTGQQRNDYGLMLWEDMTAKGATDADATQILREFYEAQVKAVEANVETILSGIGAGQRRSGAIEAQEILDKQKAQVKAEANAKYDAARAEQQAFLNPQSAQQFADGPEGLDKALSKFARETTPKTWKLVDAIKQELRDGMDVNQIEVRRQQLTSASKESSPEGEAAAAAKEAIDDYLDKYVTSTLFQLTDAAGEPLTPQAITLWKEAIDSWSGFRNRWDTKGILNDLTSRTMRDGKLQFTVAPEDAVNYIFSAKFLELVNKKNINRDLQTLKEQLPEDVWNQLRAEAAVKLFDGSLTTASDAATRGVSNKLSTAWATVRNENKGVIDILFTPEEQGMISSLANVTGRIANRTQNRSNSAPALGQMAANLASSLNVDVASRLLVPIYKRIAEPVVASGRAKLTTKGRPTAPRPSPIIIGGASSTALESENREAASETISGAVESVPFVGPFVAPMIRDTLAPIPPPQARVMPSAPPTRGVPGLGGGQPAPAAPAVAQGPTDMGSREMLDQLFPFG